jgi:hypothetical protein
MKKLITVPLLILFCSMVQASDFEYEAGLKYSWFSYSESNLESKFSPNFNISYDLNARGQKASLNLDYFATSGKASGSNIGQNAKGYGLTAKWHYRLNVSRAFQDFWSGAGLKYSEVNLDSRHTVDEQGFLDTELSDKKLTTTSLSLSLSKLFFIDNRKESAIKLSIFYDQPFSSGITEYGLVSNYKF